MNKLNTKPLTETFGLEVMDVDLRDVTADTLYPEIRDAFERHTALLFRGQDLSPEDHVRLASLFGPLEDRLADEKPEGAPFEVPQVSNVTKDGGVTAADDLHTLNLIANQLWHTDSTFLPVPALVNILMARIVPDSGGETELASTRAAWKDMPEDLKERARDAVIWHRYGHSRIKISEELAKQQMFTKWPDQVWRAIWPNPVTGEEAIYIASHAYKVEGLDDAASEAFIDELVTFCTQPKYVYTQSWTPGDVLIWDERAALHRGRPWPYEQARHLSSICCSVVESDGLSAVRGRAA